jgi:hypothetical protein
VVMVWCVGCKWSILGALRRNVARRRRGRSARSELLSLDKGCG